MTEFSRKEVVDKPGIIGARWWHENLAQQATRRQAVKGLAVLGGVLAAMGVVGAGIALVARSPSTPSEPAPEDVRFEPRSALEMQQQYGWNFGAVEDPLVFDGQSQKAFDRSALSTMTTDLSPSRAEHLPFFVSTLFQAPSALRKQTLATDAASYAPLSQALVPIFTPAMDTAFAAGLAYATLMKDPRGKDVATIVDLPGPEAVAFAAGAANVLDPVFLFDNWPHPHGVVPAHLTLAAAAYFQPLFAAARKVRPKTARPLFVLDRKRLAAYSDEKTQFDNRHTSRLPSAAPLAGLGVKDIVYVSPDVFDRLELDDLVDDFLAYAPKMPLHVVPATAFTGDAAPDGGARAFFYGGSAKTHPSFFTDWTSTTSTDATKAQPFTPTPRATAFSSGSAGGTRPRPTNFGMVPVAIAVGTGAILGARMMRSGSWNRTTSTSSSS